MVSCRALLILGVVSILGCGRPAPEPSSGTEGTAGENVELRFESHALDRPEGGCPDGSQSCTRVSLAWTEIAEAPPGVARETINRWVEAALLAPPSAAGAAPVAAASPEALAESLVERADGRTLERTVEVIHHDDHVVSFRDRESWSAGETATASGSHTLETYTTLYLTTGQPVALDDLLVAGHRERLLEIAEAKFREQRGLAPNEDLAAAGFWFGHHGPVPRSAKVAFELPDNFALTGLGLTFHYNPADIAPDRVGPTTFEIRRSELVGVVQWPG